MQRSELQLYFRKGNKNVLPPTDGVDDTDKPNLLRAAIGFDK